MPNTSGPIRLDAEVFRLLRELINELCGILLSDEAILTVERKLEGRLHALSVPSFREYYHYLRYHPQRKAEIERAIEMVTTNETYFFRELPQLNAFATEVLPQLQHSARDRRTLTVWSAGCSTGEEVYTLAILIARSGLFKGWEVRVVGNDISRRVLHVARRGVYRDSSFRAMPAEYDRHFLAHGEGREIEPDIKAMCHFAHLNLLDDARVSMLGHVDAVFCRNVLIYFDSASRKRVIQGFYDRLHPEGYLMLGHSESLLHMSTAFELSHLRGDLSYRKPGKPDPATSRIRRPQS